MSSRYSKQEIEDAKVKLREILKPGDTVYTILRHVSRSGMSRGISTIAHTADGPEDVTWLVARAAGYALRDYGSERAIRADGCGMDMGFHLVYSLSRVLFPDGHGCIGEKCPSNDHSNGDRDYTPHNWMIEPLGNLKEHWHRNGGYALRQVWL